MRKWIHEVDLDWLSARKNYLTATDVVGLLPELKRQRKKSKSMEEALAGSYSLPCAQLWMEKHSDVELDPWAPSDDAARGHIMEPYAIRDFNKLSPVELFPYDDLLIAAADGFLAFSPDALDVLQPPLIHITEADFFCDEYTVRRMGEVKSYSPRRHLECLLEDKMEHKERYQIAVGMSVMPTIEQAALIFYNPSTPTPLGIHVYRRDELTQELNDIQDIVAMYKLTADYMQKFLDGKNKQWFETQFTEPEIYQNYLNDLEDVMKLYGN